MTSLADLPELSLSMLRAGAAVFEPVKEDITFHQMDIIINARQMALDNMMDIRPVDDNPCEGAEAELWEQAYDLELVEDRAVYS